MVKKKPSKRSHQARQVAAHSRGGGPATSQNCDILPWKFRVYVEPSGRSSVQASIDNFGPAGTEFFKAAVRYLSICAKADWRRPKAAKLKGYKDLYEIRFRNVNVQTRPTGYFGPGRGEFTITIVCTEKDNVYSPANAFDIADARRRSIDAGQAGTAALKVYGSDFPPLPE